MPLRIESDYKRFRDIVKGTIKKDFKKFITQSELFGKQGKSIISIPIPQVDIPHIVYGEKEKGGVGAGEGGEGDPIGQGDEPGQGKAGSAEGHHVLEVDLSIEELAKIMGAELELPDIKPKGHRHLEVKRDHYVGIQRNGPRSLRHFKRTYKEALKRQIASRTYDANNPIIIPIKEDFRFRSAKPQPIPKNNAVVIYMMDVSGSMGDEQKEMVRIETFWINTWLKSQYKGVETRFIIHDAVAKEVTESAFFSTRESGGTMISSAYRLCAEIIKKDYDPSEWNIYPFHFSDGDNWSSEDTAICMGLLKESLLPSVNMFGYGQVDSQYGSGQFIKDLETAFKEDDGVVTSRIANKEAIYASIKTFLGKGN